MSATDDAGPSGAVNIPVSADLAPGVLLREARERLNLSQDDIASKLKLAARQINAIEAGDWNSLPERTFTRGFMRSYARLVGLNPDIVGLDRSPSQPQTGGELKPTPEAIGEVTMEHNRGKSGAARWAVPVVLVAVLAAGVTYFQWGELLGLGALKAGSLFGQSSATKPPLATANATNASAAAGVNVTSGPDAAAAAPATAVPGGEIASSAAGALLLPPPPLGAQAASGAPAAPAVATLAPSAPLLAVSGNEKRIVITFKGKSWTEVRSKGDVIYSEASLPGTKEFNGVPPLSFIVGNASNVALSIDGKPYDMSSLTRNDVARFRIE